MFAYLSFLIKIEIFLFSVVAPAMLTDYQDKWVPLLQALVGLFELPEDDTIPDDEHFIDVEDTAGLLLCEFLC